MSRPVSVQVNIRGLLNYLLRINHVIRRNILRIFCGDYDVNLQSVTLTNQLILGELSGVPLVHVGPVRATNSLSALALAKTSIRHNVGHHHVVAGLLKHPETAAACGQLKHEVVPLPLSKRIPLGGHPRQQVVENLVVVVNRFRGCTLGQPAVFLLHWQLRVDLSVWVKPNLGIIRLKAQAGNISTGLIDVGHFRH